MMRPVPWKRLFRVVLAIVTPVSITLVSCTPPGGITPPPQNNGPSFVINSPADGASVGGTTFFSVQPFNPDEVQSVSFTAGGSELTADDPGEDTFKVFLIPSDFPAGELTLSAVVTGKDGTRTEKSITVSMVADPPSSATVTEDGAILGTREENGALSTLNLPAGTAEGASVTFEARTQDEVKTETGVDYDALGVTFLGAQEISSSLPLERPVAVSSGGFGPMVQPGQAVVNYMIAPDGDNDGVGELMVVNTASVAPNGDVVSNPVPQLQLGAATNTDGSGTQTLDTLQAGTLSGPPGTFVEIESTGFNPFSAFGNVAVFESSVDGTEIELPALVNSHFENEAAVSTIGAYIPPLPAGAATLTLKNVSSSATTDPIAITVEAPPALAEEPAVVIDEALAEAITVLSEIPDLQPGVSKLEEVRTQFAELGSNPTPEEAQVLNDIAVFMSNSNMNDLLSQIEGVGSSNLSAQACSPQNIAIAGGITGYGAFMVTMAVILALAASGPFGVPVFGIALLYAAGGGFMLGGGFARLLGEVAGCLIPPPQQCLPPYTQEDLAPFSPRGVRNQQASSPIVTGMGSVFPAGGDSCGSAIGNAPESSRLGSSQTIGQGSLFGDLAGRFTVKIFFGGSNLVPFTGVSDSSGYFYIPTVPAGQPFEAVAIDTLTGETRSFEGTGPEVGTSTYMFFDFLSEGEGGANVISYDTNTEGVHDGLDIYFFEGGAGDRINLAVFSEEVNVGGINFELSDPNGQSLITGRALGGRYFETRTLALFTNGLYTFTLDGSEASGAFTLGLSELAPATAIDPSVPLAGNLEALGDTQSYTFTGDVDDVLNVTLSHDRSSSLNALLAVRDPFQGEAGLNFNLVTDDINRTKTSGPRTLPVAGEYVLELSLADDFDDELVKHLGTYQIDLSLAP